MQEIKFELKNQFNEYKSFNNSNLNKKKKCFIILGHEININNFELSASGKKRCEKLAGELINHIDDEYFIIFMGLGRSELMGNCKYTISECMYNYFSKKYFFPKYSILEKNSLDTVGDAVFSHLILKKICFFGSLKVISSDWHIERVKIIFQKIYDSELKIDFITTNDLEQMKPNFRKNILTNEKNSTKEFIANFSSFNNRKHSSYDYLINNHKLYLK